MPSLSSGLWSNETIARSLCPAVIQLKALRLSAVRPNRTRVPSAGAAVAEAQTEKQEWSIIMAVSSGTS